MRRKLSVGVGAVVAAAGVASTLTAGSDLSVAAMWVVVAAVPAALVALGGVPSGYSRRE